MSQPPQVVLIGSGAVYSQRQIIALAKMATSAHEELAVLLHKLLCDVEKVKGPKLSQAIAEIECRKFNCTCT